MNTNEVNKLTFQDIEKIRTEMRNQSHIDIPHQDVVKMLLMASKKEN
jgi:hypothetical protein